jgi:hypothetical protein
MHPNGKPGEIETKIITCRWRYLEKKHSIS